MVIATRDRRPDLEHTLARLAALAERPPIVVVDNGSADDTTEVARRAGAQTVTLDDDLGAAARSVGAQQVDVPYVAFADDDSWWAPGALTRAAAVLDAHPEVALVAARVLVGPAAREDPVCAAMAASPLPREPGLPGFPVLGFVACGAVVRRDAFLAVGGFHPRFGIGGEEEILALDLAAAGHRLAYVPEVVAHHHPSPVRDPGARRRRQVRNGLWSLWLRRPAGAALRATARTLARAPRDAAALGGAIDAVRGLPWVLRERRVVPPRVERQASLLA